MFTHVYRGLFTHVYRGLSLHMFTEVCLDMFAGVKFTNVYRGLFTCLHGSVKMCYGGCLYVLEGFLTCGSDFFTWGRVVYMCYNALLLVGGIC